MLLSTAEDLARFTEELNRESDRGLALVGTALIDDLLKETLRGFFRDETSATGKLLDDANAPLGTFSARTEACLALGLIDEFEYSEIGILRRVRNEFAHAKHGTHFKSDRIQGLCSSLASDLPEAHGYATNDPRFRFTNATVATVLRLYHRPDWVMLERRKAKTWVSKDATRWRSFKDEPPPPGLMPILVLGRNVSGDDSVPR